MRRALASPLPLVVALVVALVGCADSPRLSPSGAPATPRRPGTPRVAIPPTTLSPAQQEAHVLNRLAFGPSPADLERVRRAGIAGWIRGQMRPESLPDAEVSERLRVFPTLEMSVGELAQAYPRPQQLARQAGIPKDDPDAREKARALADPDRLPRNIVRELAAQKVVRAVSSDRQLQEVLTDFWFNHFNVSVEKGADLWMVTSYERDAIRPNVFGRFRDLLEATARHPAMLFYLDNWQSAREGVTRPELRGRRRAARRARQDGETARGPETGVRRLGLNENYARELLELHTVGVDGGYTQEDVREVARCFTGWSLEPAGLVGTARAGTRAGTFVFRERAHDPGPKVVLGARIDAGGIEDGRRVLDLLARRPETAAFVSTKLCRRFVSDHPPGSLVTRVAATFLRTDGDLSEVYAEIFSSPEMWSPEAFASKTKTPLELAISAIRAAGGSTSGNSALAREIARMGEPLYACQPPTGYKETADAWVNPGALLSRVNFGLALARGRLAGVEWDAAALVAGETPRSPVSPEQLLDRVAARLLPVPMTSTTRETVLAALRPADTPADGEAPPPDPARIAGLLLGSPEFQKQ